MHLPNSREKSLAVAQMSSCRCFPGLGFYVIYPVLPLWMVCLQEMVGECLPNSALRMAGSGKEELTEGKEVSLKSRVPASKTLTSSKQCVATSKELRRIFSFFIYSEKHPYKRYILIPLSLPSQETYFRI